ncbi:MAG: energy transducer TonB [Sandaracinaceae bacterium]
MTWAKIGQSAAFAGASIATHAALFYVLGLSFVFAPARATVLPPAEVEVVTVTPEPEPEPEPAEEPEPEPAPVEEPEPEVEPPPPRPDPPPPERAVPPPLPPPPAEEPPPPAEEAPVDFTGMTLEGGADSSWTSAVGNGQPMEGPVGAPGAQVTGRRVRGTRGGVVGGTGDPEGPRTVALRDLSQRPSPPLGELRRLLERNFPRRAQQLGIEGRAVVRMRVASDGRVRPLGVVSESYEGFGDACRQTLRQSPRWQPPVDRAGNPVDTITSFTCTFTIAN